MRSSRLKVLHFWLDSCIVNKGEKFELEMACWMNLEGFQVVSSHFWALVCTSLTGRGHRSDQSECWTYSHVAHRSDRWCWSVWLVRAELLQLPCCQVVFCMHSSRELHWFRGSLHVCRGSSLWFFELWFGGLHSLLEHSFVSDVSSRYPCLRGPRFVFFKCSCSLPLFGFRSLVGVSFLFIFSRVTLCGCCQCTHQGGDWVPCVVRGLVDGRFLVWWVIDNVVWTNSWLSIAGAGCGLTGVGAGEEQSWKVVVSEASRCEEDK
jgi:hypothetical protein